MKNILILRYAVCWKKKNNSEVDKVIENHVCRKLDGLTSESGKENEVTTKDSTHWRAE